MAIRIRTNNVPRFTVDGFELTAKELKEFDYLTLEEIHERDFVRYKGQVYDIGDFERTGQSNGCPFGNWDGYQSDSFFSGILLKWAKDDAGHVDFEKVIMGDYYS